MWRTLLGLGCARRRSSSKSSESSRSMENHESQAERMAKAFETGDITDVCFKVGGGPLAVNHDDDEKSPNKSGEVQMVSAHKVVLAIGSPVFKAMFFGPLAEQAVVDVSDISAESFRKMISFMYFAGVDLSDDDVMEVLYAAKKYDISSLEKQCCEKINNILNRDNAPTIYSQAMLFGEHAIAESAIDVLDRYAHYAINTNDVVSQFDRDLFRTLLTRDTFCAREVDIFDALIWWTKLKLGKSASPTQIREFLGDMLYLVRFPQMTTKEILQIVLPMGLLQGQEIFEVLYHTFPTKKRSAIKITGMFPTKRRSTDIPVVLKVSQLPGNVRASVSVPDDKKVPPEFRFERLYDKGMRSIRVRFDCRLFLTRISLTGVPHSLTTDNCVVTVRLMDTVLKELVHSFEFLLGRDDHLPPLTATYKLDCEPVELCPKIIYEFLICVEQNDPEVKIVKLPAVRDYNTVRFQYYKELEFPSDMYVDELQFTT